jgi:hypothetical protein
VKNTHAYNHNADAALKAQQHSGEAEIWRHVDNFWLTRRGETEMQQLEFQEEGVYELRGDLVPPVKSSVPGSVPVIHIRLYVDSYSLDLGVLVTADESMGVWMKVSEGWGTGEVELATAIFNSSLDACRHELR